MNRNTLSRATTGTFLISVAFALYACSSASTPSALATTARATDAGSVGDTRPEEGGDASAVATYPAPHAPSPQVDDYGGPVITSPIIVPIDTVHHPIEARQCAEPLGRPHRQLS